MDDARQPVLIALGSNVAPEENLVRAAGLLAGEMELLAASKVYEGEPVGAPGTPRFLNAVLRVSSRRGPRSLKFGVLRALEGRLGRHRGPDPNAPRTIDLDLVLFGDRVEASADLVLPDPALADQAHVLVPAADVAGDYRHPVTGETLSEMARGLEVGLIERPDLVLGAPGP